MSIIKELNKIIKIQNNENMATELPGVIRNADEILRLGKKSVRMNLFVYPLLVFPTVIALCYFFLFKNIEKTGARVLYSGLASFIPGLILWYIVVKISNKFYINKIKELSK